MTRRYRLIRLDDSTCLIIISKNKDTVRYGCSFVAKFSKWLLHGKKMYFRSLGNDFFMFNKRFLYSMNDFYMFNEWFPLPANDFYMFNKWFLYSAIDFYIQQEICIFSNLKFVFSNMRFIFNNLRFAFNEMKFIKLNHLHSPNQI